MQKLNQSLEEHRSKLATAAPRPQEAKNNGKDSAAGQDPEIGRDKPSVATVSALLLKFSVLQRKCNPSNWSILVLLHSVETFASRRRTPRLISPSCRGQSSGSNC